MDVKAELYKTAASTFEEVGFIFLSPEFNDQHREAKLEAAVSVDFDGPLSGKLIMAAYGDLLPTLAANMLGDGGIPPVDKQLDAFCEIANIVCGNLIPRIAGKVGVFKVAAPKLMQTDGLAGCMREPGGVEVQLPLEEGRADVTLFIR